MEIVPAPGRHFKTFTMILGLFIGSFDAIVLLLNSFSDLHVMSTQTVLAINAVLGFLIVPAKLIVQNIPVTTEQKVEIIAAAAAQPMKVGEANVITKIDGAIVPAVPKSEDVPLPGDTGP